MSRFEFWTLFALLVWIVIDLFQIRWIILKDIHKRDALK
jgi:hypothetical protein